MRARVREKEVEQMQVHGDARSAQGKVCIRSLIHFHATKHTTLSYRKTFCPFLTGQTGQRMEKHRQAKPSMNTAATEAVQVLQVQAIAVQNGRNMSPW